MRQPAAFWKRLTLIFDATSLILSAKISSIPADFSQHRYLSYIAEPLPTRAEIDTLVLNQAVIGHAVVKS